MIYVCDQMMGSGKSTAAINYIDSHPDKKFIYVTPFLSEASRIAESCKSVQFFEPIEDKKYRWCKTIHTAQLVEHGCSVATTHKAFIAYPRELLQKIREQHYTLIIDENLQVVEPAHVRASYIELAQRCGLIAEVRKNTWELVDKDNRGDMDEDLFFVMQTKNLLTAGKKTQFFWQLPPDLIEAFDDTFVLTYMFEGQGLHLMFQMFKMAYENIGVDYTDGVYSFAPLERCHKKPVRNPRDLLTILHDDKLNAIGNGPRDLCKSWYRDNKDGRERVKKNVYNFFKNIAPARSGCKIWSTFADYKECVKDKGYMTGFVACNSRSTNEHRDATSLAYTINLFFNTYQQTMFRQMGVEFDGDLYSLSTLVQWIWRSAIRDGKPVTLYLPSRRMRELLEGWLNSFET